jgi:hypothetical protein
MIITMTDDELANAPFIICAPASDPALFADDNFGDCAECGQRVRFRPHVPPGPKRICLPCAAPMILEAMNSGTFKAGLSSESIKELNRFGKHS